MKHSSASSCRSPTRAFTLLGLTTTFACGAHPGADPASPSAPAGDAAAAQVSEPASEPVVRPSSKSGEAADRVVLLVAKPGLWPLDAEAARRVLQALGPVA